MVLQQVFIDSKYADFTYESGQAIHWLADPIEKPEGTVFKVHVLSAWIPLTYFNVFPGNNTLVISYGDSTSTYFEFPPGNRDIDDLLEVIQSQIKNGFVVSYNAATNKIQFSGGTSVIFIEGSSTSLEFLGFEPNQVGFGALTAKYGVDLTRTSSILMRSNLHGTNRDPFTKRMSNILCKIPVSHQQPNEIIEYTQPAFIRITNPTIDHFVLGLYDDDGRPLDLNGNRWTVTLQISIEKDDSHDPTIPRYLSNEPLDDRSGEPEGQPKDETQRESR